MSNETKDTSVVVHHDDVATAQKLGVEVEKVAINRLTEDDMNRASAETLKLYSWTGFRIFLIIIVMGFNQAGYGIDWAVIGNINSYKTWHDYFGFDNAGPVLGTINALMQIGTFCGAPFLALSDVIGRRGVNFLGNALVVVAALTQGLAPNLPCFMIGRFILGFGTALCSSSQYMAEIAPVHLRGRLVGVFGACFQIGSIVMTAALMGFSQMEGTNWQWRIPLILQSVAPIFVLCTIYFICPESPRYYVMKGQSEKARAVIAKYMTTDNDVNAPIVPMVLAQIEDSLESSRTGVKAAWDFRPFFTKTVGFRTFVLLIYSIFQQWNGGGIIGYYLSPALETIGITESIDQIGINLGLTAIYFVFTAFGSWLIDIFNRRTLIFAGLITFILCQTAATITSWQYSLAPTTATAALTVLWMFIYQICSASLIATMHNLYPVEILSLPLRAKGMGLYSVFQGAAGVVQSYGISVGIEKVGYKIWVVYIVYNMVQLVASYFIFPETSKLSLEEIDTIFETPGANPVKLSLKIQAAKKERAKAEREAAESAA